MNVTEKQKRFVDEYLIDLNGTRAYKEVYKSCKKDETARANASRLLTNANVQSYLNNRQKEIQKRTEITQDRVLQEYAKLAFFDPRKLFNDDGTTKEISQLDDETAAALSGLDVTENWEYDEAEEKRVKNGFTKKYKLSDKKGALDSIARHLGMFTDKIRVEGEMNVTSPLDEINRRIAGIAERTGAEQSS